MVLNSGPVDKILEFDESLRKLDNDHTEPESSVISAEAYDEELTVVLRDLQETVSRNDVELAQLSALNPHPQLHPGLSPAAQLAHIRRATTAYQFLSQNTPVLPATVINDGLKDRVQAMEKLLRDKQGDSGAIDPAKRAEVVRKELHRKIVDYNTRAESLTGTLHSFIDRNLAPMIAAEDLGGPVAGNRIDVPIQALETGYTASGKEKKSKLNRKSVGDPRQQRIDSTVDGRPSGIKKRDAAGKELHDLVDSLFAASEASSYINTYINIKEESAAVRFLTRARIAQFHPHDSLHLRLIDFAREFSDIA